MSTGQSDAAAERSFHEPVQVHQRYSHLTEIAPGVFKLAAIVKLEREIEALRAENAALRAQLPETPT